MLKVNLPGIRFELNRLNQKDIAIYFIDYRSLPPLPNIPVTVFIAYNPSPNPQNEDMLKQLNLNSAIVPSFDKIRTNAYLKFLEYNGKASVICLPKFTHYMHIQDPKLIAAGIQLPIIKLY